LPLQVSPPDRPALLVDIQSARDGARLVIADGEIDLETSPMLADAVRDVLDGDDPARVVLDLAAVTFIDSTGISLLLTSAEQARRQGTELRVEPSPVVRRVLGIAGVDRVLPLSPR
jgi:anti-anti-sigma factor